MVPDSRRAHGEALRGLRDHAAGEAAGEAASLGAGGKGFEQARPRPQRRLRRAQHRQDVEFHQLLGRAVQQRRHLRVEAVGLAEQDAIVAEYRDVRIGAGRVVAVHVPRLPGVDPVERLDARGDVREQREAVVVLARHHAALRRVDARRTAADFLVGLARGGVGDGFRE